MENFQFNWRKGDKPKDLATKAYREDDVKEQIGRFREGREYHAFTNELPQTGDQRALTEAVTSFFEERLKQLNVSKKLEFPYRHFRFFDRSGYEKEFPDSKGEQGFHGKYGLIVVVEGDSKIETIITLFHETAHAASAHKYALIEKQPKEVPLYRLGYQTADANSEQGIANDEKLHYKAFNEGVVEFTAMSMLGRYQDVLQKKGLLAESESGEGVRVAYAHCVHVVMAIVGGLAKAGNIEVAEMWDKIEKGQYTGEMMWMRDMDKVFGKGSLRVLDCLSVENDKEAYKRNQIIWQYFMSEDEEERQKIQEQLY